MHKLYGYYLSDADFIFHFMSFLHVYCCKLDRIMINDLICLFLYELKLHSLKFTLHPFLQYILKLKL